MYAAANMGHPSRKVGLAAADHSLLCQPNSPSQVDIPVCVSVTLKIEIQASKGSKQFNHVFCNCR
jgi:hypothetical protein